MEPSSEATNGGLRRKAFSALVKTDSQAQKIDRLSQHCSCAPCGPPKIQLINTVVWDNCLVKTSTSHLAR